MDSQRRAAALRTLASTPAGLEALLGGLEDERAEMPVDEGWSPKDVVAHLLVTIRLGAVDRIRAVVQRDAPELAAFDENQELARSGFRERPLSELLNEFTRERAEAVGWLGTLDDALWQRRGRHSEAGEVGAEELLYHAAYHDLQHLGQLARMLQQHFEPHRGAMRMY